MSLATDRIVSLNLLYWPFRVRFERGLTEAQTHGIPVRAFETFRLRERQAYLWAQGRDKPGPKVTWLKPGDSTHHYGVAADVVMYIDEQYNWSITGNYHKLGPIMEDQGLVWLGRTTNDLGHYQYPGASIYTLKSQYAKGGLEQVWLYLDGLGG